MLADAQRPPDVEADTNADATTTAVPDRTHFSRAVHILSGWTLLRLLFSLATGR